MQKSNCEVEVLVHGKPLREYAHDGRIYVEGKAPSAFSIRLRNNSWKRKLFIPSIDGLSVIEGKECGFDSAGYVVKPYSSVTIDGWRINDREVAEFYFSSPGDSYRKRMEKGNNLGVIGVAVFDEKERPQPIVVKEYIHQHHCHDSYCWLCQGYHCNSGFHMNLCNRSVTFTNTGMFDLGATTASGSNQVMVMNASNPLDPAAHERVANGVFSQVSQDIGTGWGDTKRSEVTSVDFEREENPAAIFEIFYNTREQLERMGIDLSRESLQMATPQAFPGRYCEPPKR